ncbi:MAG: hypothetical protein ACLQBD_04050 [Syntrophobacteraceae bacterium]
MLFITGQELPFEVLVDMVIAAKRLGELTAKHVLFTVPGIL